MKISSSAPSILPLAVCCVLVALLLDNSVAFQTTINSPAAAASCYTTFNKQKFSQIGKIAVPVLFGKAIQKVQQPQQRQQPTFLQETTSSADAAASAASMGINDTTSANNNINGLSNNKKPSFVSVLWRFSRPHTMIGSALAVPALHLLALAAPSSIVSTRSLSSSILYAMVPALLMNVYVTGLNQITDVSIDQINKPDLPIAAGDLSRRSAITIVLVSLVASLLLGFGFAHPTLSTPGLKVALGYSAILGTLYSVPPFRWKRFPVLAAFCIVAVRGAVINAGFFAHAKAVAAHAAAFGGSAAATATTTTTVTVWQCLRNDPRCWMSSLYFAVFGVVIALMKDVPDVKGDEQSNVRTFSVRLGPKRVYPLMQRLLTGLFWGVGVAFLRGAAVGGANSDDMWIKVSRLVVGVCAMLAGVSVQKEGSPVDPENPKQVYGFYMHLWKLFYLSYLVLPLAR